MEKFWAVILIFVVVAAAGLMYVNQVYNPQKETQMAMAQMANQTLTAVKLEIGDGTITFEVIGSGISGKIGEHLEAGEGVTITLNGVAYNDGIANIGSAVEPASNYKVVIVKKSGETTRITITKL
ncbi:MAG: hypothetical protein APF77_03205 [Clostridia bacterium BRH_c25]|nr:MAG: hypothetical protein APF77_03205 [Clostridia bacterium BRH_c25]